MLDASIIDGSDVVEPNERKESSVIGASEISSPASTRPVNQAIYTPPRTPTTYTSSRMSGQYEQIQALVLQTLDKSPNGTIPDSRELNLSTPEAQTTLKAVLDSLLSKEVGPISYLYEGIGRWKGNEQRADVQMVEYKQITTTSFILSEEGGMIVKNGSHEYRVWEVLPAPGGSAMPIPDLKVGDVCSVEESVADRVEIGRRGCHEDWTRKGIEE